MDLSAALLIIIAVLVVGALLVVLGRQRKIKKAEARQRRLAAESGLSRHFDPPPYDGEDGEDKPRAFASRTYPEPLLGRRYQSYPADRGEFPIEADPAAERVASEDDDPVIRRAEHDAQDDLDAERREVKRPSGSRRVAVTQETRGLRDDEIRTEHVVPATIYGGSLYAAPSADSEHDRPLPDADTSYRGYDGPRESTVSSDPGPMADPSPSFDSPSGGSDS